MATTSAYPRNSQELEKDNQTSTVTEEQDAVEACSGIAMIKDAYKRFASPSFPPELRLQVMKAGVLHNTSCWRVDPILHTMDSIRNAALSSLLAPELWDSEKRCFTTDWLDTEMRSTLADTAEQAFLETVIFEIEADFTSRGRIATLRIPPVLAAVGAGIHHLDMAVFVTMNNYAFPEALQFDSSRIPCMESLKLHFPNLKACILTLDVHFYTVAELRRRFNSRSSPVAPFDKRLLQTACGLNPEYKPLHSAFAELFEEFADVAPGKSQFVRVRFRSRPAVQPGKQAMEHFSYGPLVKVDRTGEETRLGDRLLDAAFQLERTGGSRSLSEELLRARKQALM